MKNFLMILTPFLLYPVLHASFKPGTRALVMVPVADASGVKIEAMYPRPKNYYAELTQAPDTGVYSCLRIHQPIFNEIVTIREEYKGGEVAVEVSGFFYLDGIHRKRHDFWMLKKDLLPLSSLKQEMLEVLPPSIDYTKSVNDYSQNVLTLSKPWADSCTKYTYSVGTRFVRDQKVDTQDAYGIVFLDTKKKKVVRTTVPKASAVIPQDGSFSDSRQIFLSLLHEWAKQGDQLVPYVYGGCSFTQTTPRKGFSRVSGKKCGLPASYWERHESPMNPCIGFDCSGMILRAAQIAGLPYFFKNTLALMNYLQPLKLGEPLELGDLVWYSGHVLVVSNLQKNLLIEAVGYESGFGRVHEIPISEAFSDITTFEQLIHAHLTHQSLRRPNSKGQPWRSIVRLKIFKLSSILPLSLILAQK